MNKPNLTDRFGRIHNYLRLSITSDCNFACSYCRLDDKKCDVSGNLMSADEIVDIASAFSELGIEKIRLTGGEPLLHKQIDYIIHYLTKLPVELAVTTNGFLLDKHFSTLKKNGVQKLNISLDTLKKERFKHITQRNAFERVFANLILAIKLGFEVKVNAVIMRGTNEDELKDFALLTTKYPIAVRFIEFMPFRDNNWNFGKTFSQNNIIETLTHSFSLQKINSDSSTAEYFRIEGAKGKIGTISTLSHPFCDDCNRIRVTADGKIKNCLFGSNEIDLIRPHNEKKNIRDIIIQALDKKPLRHGGNSPMKKTSDSEDGMRSMFSIGG